MYNKAVIISARSSMDRVLVFGTSDVGSIPAGRTSDRKSKFICFCAGIENLFHVSVLTNGKGVLVL